MPHTDDPSADELGHQLRRALQTLPDAPLALQRAAIGLWPAATPAGSLKASAQALIGHIAAVLAFDSWAQPVLAMGMRSLRSPTRQLLFSASGRDIDLRIAPEGQAWTLSGQVLGPDDSGKVELVPVADDGSPARPVSTAALDGLGEFRIPGLARGSYRLTLKLGSEVIVLPPVAVGERLG